MADRSWGILLSSVLINNGLAMMLVGIGINQLKLAQDYSFWLYLLGTALSFGGLSCLSIDSLNYLGIFLTLFIVVGALVNCQRLVVFGSLGVLAYLVWLSGNLFWDSWSYLFVLTAIGLLIVFISILVQKYIMNSPLCLGKLKKA